MNSYLVVESGTRRFLAVQAPTMRRAAELSARGCPSLEGAVSVYLMEPVPRSSAGPEEGVVGLLDLPMGRYHIRGDDVFDAPLTGPSPPRGRGIAGVAAGKLYFVEDEGRMMAMMVAAESEAEAVLLWAPTWEYTGRARAYEVAAAGRAPKKGVLGWADPLYFMVEAGDEADPSTFRVARTEDQLKLFER